MKKTLRKVLAAMLVLSLVIGVFPAAAFAEETDTQETEEEQFYIEPEESPEPAEEPFYVQPEEEMELIQPAGADAEKARRTILLYDCGADLETDAGLASYNLRQILRSAFSADEDIRFIVMTGGSYRWQLEKEYLEFPDGVNVPEDAGLQRDAYDPEYEVLLDNKSVISGVYNQLWEAKGIDAPENPGKLVLLDGDGITGEDGEAVTSEEELMSGPETLKAFINYCVENYPAEKYDLILWDHGGGPAGGFGADEHYGYMPGTKEIMPFADIIDALSDNAVTNNDADGDGENDKFDFIDFDACLMNSVELALTIADYTDYYIASAETEPGYGQYYGPQDDRYTGWLDLLGQDPDHDTYDLGKVIVDDFYNFYEKEEGDGASQDGTLAVIDTKKMIDSRFVSLLTALTGVLIDQACAPYENGIRFYDELKSYYNSIEYGSYELFDLGQVASLLSVVNSEVSEYDLDREDDYYINCNNYGGISKELIQLLDNDSPDAFMYARGTSGIRSKENYYRTKDGQMGYGALGTSGMSVYFPGLEFATSAMDYFSEIDPVIEKMPDDDRKAFLQDYEEALAYYSLILYTGRTIERLINDENDELEITDKSEVDYDLVMSGFKEGFFRIWDDIMVPAMSKMQRVPEEEVQEDALEDWFRALISQQVEDAIDRSLITVEKQGQDVNAACRITVNGVRKSIVNSVERNVYVELPVLEAYVNTLSPSQQSTVQDWGNLSLGSVTGRLNSLPEGSSVAEMIKWYNESGGVWDLDALEQKWYAISDAENGFHVASLYHVDEDGFYVPAAIGTGPDAFDPSRLILLEFSNRESDGDDHVLTSVWFVDPDAGPIKVELKDLTGELSLMPIHWIKPFMVADIYAPISRTSFKISADNAKDISLKYTDVDQIGDIGDTDGDGKVLDSSITITDLYGYKVEVSDRIHIKNVRIRPGIYDRNDPKELVPEVVYMGRTLQEGIDYIFEKDGYYDPEAGAFVIPDYIEPGDYPIVLMGKGLFRSTVYTTFHIVLPEEEAAQAVEDARTALEAAREAMQTAIETGEGLQDAYNSLVTAQQALTDAQDALARTVSILSEEEQAMLQDEIDKLEQDVQDLSDQLAEAQVVDISNYAVTLAKTSYEYTGSAIKPSVKVSGLTKNDYTVTYSNNKKIGTAKVTIKAKGDKYKGTIVKTFKITKKTNPLSVKGKTVNVKYKTIKKKNKTLAASKVRKFVKKGKGTLTYKKVSGDSKITINKKTGKVTVKKGLKKGTYKVKVKVKAAGNATYKASAWKTITITVKVK